MCAKDLILSNTSIYNLKHKKLRIQMVQEFYIIFLDLTPKKLRNP